PILMLEGFFQPADLPLLEHYTLTPVIHSDAQVEMLGRAELARPLAIYLKANTGMNRLGFDAAGLRLASERVAASRNVKRITLMTHFADADGAAGVRSQLAAFGEMTRAMPGERSTANSAALVAYPEARGDWVRPG